VSARGERALRTLRLATAAVAGAAAALSVVAAVEVGYRYLLGALAWALIAAAALRL
jgi:hypothetical protein